jgi:hypothetical protein
MYVEKKDRLHADHTDRHNFGPTAKTQYRKFETNIPSKGLVRPQSQFPHSCVCERFSYSNDRSAYSAAGNYVDRSWEYINDSQKLRGRNSQKRNS